MQNLRISILAKGIFKIDARFNTILHNNLLDLLEMTDTRLPLFYFFCWVHMYMPVLPVFYPCASVAVPVCWRGRGAVLSAA